MAYSTFKYGATAFAVVASLTLVGCSDDDDQTPAPEPESFDYVVTVTNLTANQPFSPVAVVAHQADTPLWTAGMPASVALETLAESGDGSGLATETGVAALVSGSGIIAPGMSETINLSLTAAQVSNLSVVTMLVNTNDAFTGLGNYDISALAAGSMVKMRTITYDAGTENNSEAKGTIPGPADGGEGFNAARDDVNRVHSHPGVISADDGLSDSVLGASHRFDNPTMSVTIARSE
ncbi:spondin domain-containing protein [Shewanella gelidii]|uniref:Spondin domain-containing protein n=1 Tax=Shewanella gelidii TaxID=1642821 RepID=A0A917JSS8_9GAMM|nr:spondin domain-containing protein [Shewanella gelidii]MCL1099551.1 spondin domain-containing protein [Shewanella gelidii]GGI80725.1 hypothetical protein GCM10009332_17590 [Shewanella gelidii]